MVINAIGLELDERFGWLIGLVAAMLTLAAQTILAYSAMVMLEVPGLLVSLATLWAFLRETKQPTAWRLAFVSLLRALTVLAKYPYGTIVVPTILAMEISRVLNGIHNPQLSNGGDSAIPKMAVRPIRRDDAGLVRQVVQDRRVFRICHVPAAAGGIAQRGKPGILPAQHCAALCAVAGLGAVDSGHGAVGHRALARRAAALVPDLLCNRDAGDDGQASKASALYCHDCLRRSHPDRRDAGLAGRPMAGRVDAHEE